MNDKTLTKYVLSWFARGDDDIRACEILLSKKGAPNTICFHAQQAAEKYLNLLSPSGESKFKKEQRQLILTK